MSATHTCPRRAEAGNYPFAEGWPKEDTWRDGTGFANAPHVPLGVDVRSCSYCGSIHPEDFLALVEKGAVVGPTDKNYKTYLNLPADEAAVREQATERVRRMGLDPESEPGQKLIAQDVAMSGGAAVGKFYTQHLSPEQGDRFRALLESGKMAVGFPGYFYARIYVPKTGTAEVSA